MARDLRPARALCAVAVVAALLTGCPYYYPPGGSGQLAYDRGFDAGFALDIWYWDGYFDGYDTLEFEPVFYDTSGIPYIDELTYDAGYYDGIWFAYNDGYFVDYRYAFIIGFSEGYDSAFYPDYLDFLAMDQHVEFLNGGWGDGYNDGFSEGRVFGANDYEQGLPFDWEDALLDYERGTDLYFVEVDVGTGIFGPVLLYEYGTDPLATKTLRAPLKARPGGAPAIRKASAGASIYRPLTSAARSSLEILPIYIPRGGVAPRLDTTWLDRVNSYLDGKSGKSALVPRSRSAGAE